MADKILKLIISAVDDASRTLDKIGGNVQTLSSQMTKAGAVIAGMGAAITGVGVVLVKEAAKFEQYGVAFETMLGSAEQATKTLAELKDFAKKTPFNLEELVDGSKRLMAYGMEANELIPTLQMLGNITAGVGREKLPQLILAFGQVKAATRLTGMELRQFSETGVPMLDALAKKFGKTAREIQDMVSSGDISYGDVKQALVEMTTEGGKFFNLMEKQSLTAAGKFSNLQDALQQTAVQLGNALLPAVNAVLTAIIPFIEKLAAFASEHPKITLAIFAIGAGLLVLGTIITTVGLILGGLAAAAAALGIAVLPLVLIIGGVVLAIGLLIAAGYLLITHWDQIKAFVATTWENITTTIKTALTNIITWFQELPAKLGEAITTFFTSTLPYIVGFGLGAIGGLILIKVPEMVKNFITFLSQLIPAVLTIFSNIVKTILTKITEAGKNLQTEVSSWPAKFGQWISSLPTIASETFEAIKQAINNKLTEAKQGIKNFVDWAGEQIRKIADAIGGVLGKIGEGVSKGINAVSRQHGGIIPGGSGTVVPTLLHGGERVLPRTGTDVNAGTNSGGGITINLIVEGDVSSTATLDAITNAVKSALGRDNELAQMGVGI